jgi:hypothetical protein
MISIAVRCLVVGGLLTGLVAACGGSGDDGSGSQEGAATAPTLRPVDIIVSAKRTGENYEARSYPNDDFDDNGQIELYNAPVFFVFIDGVDAAGNRVRREWKTPRYMPYYNDPANPVREYKTLGFVNAGLSSVPRQAVPQYKPEYEVHNRFSPFGGAIVVKGTFYIHAGPAELAEAGWGSAGCVEILGNFDTFKANILELAGSTETNLNKGIGQLVAAKKLFVTYEPAERPNLKAAFSRQVSTKVDESDSDSRTDRTDPE